MVSLTREGALLLGEVQQTVQRVEHLQNTIKQVAAGRRGMLRIGYVGTSMLEPALVKIIRAFRRDFPQIALQPVEYSVNQQLSLLESGDLDIGILRGRCPNVARLAGKFCIKPRCVRCWPTTMRWRSRPASRWLI